ncbi:MAG: hypothetical protein HY049_13070 [Acidobacteria bacterium]|nr:hypothetical protein [Acidobacteriota bacterium]
MHPGWAAATPAILILAMSIGAEPDRALAPLGRPAGAEKIRGVCFVAGGRLAGDPWKPIRDLGADWISQTPFAWQESADHPGLRLVTSDRVLWGETDEGLIETTRRGKAAGLKTLLAPQIWLRDHRAWRGTIAMKTEEDWKSWFAEYRAMILHYAALARDEKIEALSIGAELSAATAREAEWRAIIAEIRRIYPGKVTYAANWHQEPEAVRFWDALDWIGIQAYYPIAEDPSATREKVFAAWALRADEIGKLSARADRPVIFTEIGYRSQKGALAEPWVWHTDERVDPAVQSLGFDALFRAMWDRPWFGGLFVWKWFPDGRAGGPADVSFTPQGKPAESTIRRWFLHGGAGP